jgi:hypothetical protein
MAFTPLEPKIYGDFLRNLMILKINTKIKFCPSREPLSAEGRGALGTEENLLSPYFTGL